MKRQKQVDLRNVPVQPSPCETCPFAGKKPLRLSEDRLCALTSNLMGHGQHLCHSAGNKKICRGGRDIQLRWLCLIGALSEPTDEQFNKVMDELTSKGKM